MPTDKPKSAAGAAAAKGLMKNAAKEEAKVVSKTGKSLPKGEKRVIERSRSSDGKSPGTKQK
ncbi:MAG: hypothetical protein WBF87_12560 [Mesorhizobium sp.]